MTLEVVAILLTFVVHLAGAAVLVWALFDGERFDWRSVLRPGDDDGRGRRRRRRPDGPDSPPPLPDADQSPERFREAGRLADRKARPPRRVPPQPDPARSPQRERAAR